ncbi:MAG: response regulator [Sedimenticola sp.]
MTIPVLICDDSSFARKQVTRALPEHWDADLHYAENGEEALHLIRQGKADILFLDLTMPVLDGFGVLEAIRREELQTLPIVISGDIQPDSAHRVKQLGSIAFLKKPVQAEPLEQILREYGLLLMSDDKQIVADQSFDFRDWLQELSNVSKGRAADLLARSIEHSVELSIPSVRLLEKGELRFNAYEETGYAVSQGFTGAGIAGEMVMLFNKTDSEAIQSMLYGDGESTEAQRIEAIMDMANILGGAFLKGFCEQINIEFSVGQPLIRPQKELMQLGQLSREQLAETILLIDCHYNIGQTVSCEQLLMFTADAAKVLNSCAKALT